MGLFSNNKKPCPLCGSPTPRLLATKVEGLPICKECDRKIYLPGGALDGMKLEDLQRYMAFYDENGKLRQMFEPTYRFDFGFGNGCLLLDTAHSLLRLKDDDNALVLGGGSLRSFRIWEDDRLWMEGAKGSWKKKKSPVPGRVHALEPDIERFLWDVREFDRMERMEDRMERRERMRGVGREDRNDRNDNPPPPPPRPPRPRFNVEPPLRHFYVEISLDHPYWKSMRWELDAPEFDRDYPSAASYLQKYEENGEDLRTLAKNLMQLIDPTAREEGEDAPAAPRIPIPTVAPTTMAAATVAEELKQYKALLDAGVLTPEEFAAKKRQLLGI